MADGSGHDAIARINKVLRDHFGSRTKVMLSWVPELQVWRLYWGALKPKAHAAFVEAARLLDIKGEDGFVYWHSESGLRGSLSSVADLLEGWGRRAKHEADFKARMAAKDARIQKVNKGWKDWETYIADEQAKEKVAREVANEILARTNERHIDIKKLTSVLRHRLRGTMEAAGVLGISRGSFLRLRRKYGIEPVYVETVYQKDAQGKNVRCNKSLYYSDAQLQRIPGEECAKARHRSEAAHLRKRRSGIEQAVSRRRELIAC